MRPGRPPVARSATADSATPLTAPGGPVRRHPSRRPRAARRPRRAAVPQARTTTATCSRTTRPRPLHYPAGGTRHLALTLSPGAPAQRLGTMAVRGLFETHLTVADPQRSMAFYRDVVGLPV